MDKQWLVFGGWGVPASILRPLFGTEAQYCDINKIMPALFHGEKLGEDWVECVGERTGAENFRYIAGWSTGAFFAWELARITSPQACVLISSTPSFCRAGTFRLGYKAAVLKAMRSALAVDKEKVRRDFLIHCGIQSQEMTGEELYNEEQLRCGLLFLEQANLLPISPAAFRTCFFHGNEDRIVPVESGRFFSGQAGGIFRSYPGSHIFFSAHALEIKKDIADFLQSKTVDIK